MDKYRKAREVVLTRAQFCCERCGDALSGEAGFGFSVHHRRPRGMGGSRRHNVTSPVNLVALCGSGTTGCHGAVELNREAAYEAGWLVRQAADPALIPVDVFGRRLVFLTGDGGYYYLDATSPQAHAQTVEG